MAALYNLARMTTATTGTGSITLGSAVSGFLTFAQAGVQSGDVVSYGITDGVNSEVGTGTVTGTTLTRTVSNSTNSGAAITLSGSAQVYVTVLAANVRERLTADRAYFVRTDGLDTNHGLVNAAGAGGAFLTLQKAWNTIAALDVAGFTVTVQIGDGTYTGGVLITSWFAGGGLVVFQGNASTPGAVMHSTTSANCWDIRAAGAGVLRLKDFKLTTTTLGDHIVITAPLSLEYSGLNFGIAAGGPSGCHIRAFHPGTKIVCLGSYTISGSAFAHLLLWYGVYESGLPATVITLSGSPTWGLAYLFIDNNAKVSHVGPTFSGAATGARYNIGVLCSVRTNFAGDYFPGSVAGGSILSGGGSVYL